MPSSVRDLVWLCRPGQWTKNLFVLAPLLFSESISDPDKLWGAMVAFGCFCLLSSAVYGLNDLLDLEADRRHPRKCNRPIAAGRVTARAAGLVIALLLGTSVAAGCLLLPRYFLLFFALYLGNSLLYCLWLKHHAIVDVIVIAIGFVLRLLGGCAAITVPASSWLVVCGFSLALVLGFGKRRTEIVNLGSESQYRPSLLGYSESRVDNLLVISIAVCLLSYVLFTLARETVERHQTANLVYTVPLVAYGLFRYLFAAQEGKGDGPGEILVKDPVFSMVGLLWLAAVTAILYFR